jgi:OOP family OmpA-OmpF porin
MKPKITSLTIASVLAVLSAALSHPILAENIPGYTQTPRDNIVMNPFGECWKTGSFEEGMERPPCCPDDDEDGVCNSVDKCPDTPKDCEVDEFGCPIDTDGDGVPDCLDQCPGTPPGTPVDDVGCPLAAEFENVYFDFDKYNLRPEAMDAIDKNIDEFMKTQGTWQGIYLYGHTDAVGTDSYNQALGERRAASVREYMVSKGVPANKINILSLGESEPVASNDTADGRAQNRRVVTDTQ